MEFGKFIIAILLGCLMLVGGVMIIGEQESTYDINITQSNFANITDTTNQMTQKTEEMREQLTGRELTLATAWESLIVGSYTVLTIMWQIPELLWGIIIEGADILNIPSIFVALFMSMVVISMLFAMIYLYFKFEPK